MKGAGTLNVRLNCCTLALQPKPPVGIQSGPDTTNTDIKKTFTSKIFLGVVAIDEYSHARIVPPHPAMAKSVAPQPQKQVVIRLWTVAHRCVS